MSEPNESNLEALESRVVSLADDNRRLRAENALLRQKLDALARRVFGKKSEQLTPEQMTLLLQMGEDAVLGKQDGPEETLVPPPRPKGATTRARRQPLPEHLPVIEEIIEPEPVKANPQAWRRIGEEVSERLDYEPGRFLRRRTVRPKYVRKNAVDTVPVIAPLPGCLLERSIVTPGLLTYILVAKYCDHLPLHRQESIFWHRHQVWLPRQMMAEWVALAADWLRPLYELIKTGVMGDGYVQIDETPIHYLAPGNAKTKLGYLWTCCQPRGDVIYHWKTSRAAACLENIVPVDFRGTVQCDGYAAYRRFAVDRGPEITLAGCMAHARRGFYEAKEQAPKTAGFILRQIQHLYAVEQELRRRKAGPRLREAARASASRPIMERLHRSLVSLKARRRFLPQSLFGKAIDYALGQWQNLRVFLRDGRVEIDNNLVENAIRPTAIGKKNWLFVGDAEAGERSAIIYTLIECCRRRQIDPYAYLRDVLTRLPLMTNWQVKDLTPEAWQKSRQSALKAAA